MKQAIFAISTIVLGVVAMITAVSLYNVPVVSAHDEEIQVTIGDVDVQPADPSVNVELGNVELDDGIKGGVARRATERAAQDIEKQIERQGESKCFWHTLSMGERVRVCDSDYIPPETREVTKKNYAEQTAEISIGFEGLLK